MNKKTKSPTSVQTGKASLTSRFAADNAKFTNNIGFPEVRAAALGKWGWIHQRLGVTLVTTTHRKHTACPGCGGRDRFRVDHDYQENGRWVCSGGGDFKQGDGFALLGHVFGWSASEQLSAVKDVLGLATDMDTVTRDP